MRIQRFFFKDDLDKEIFSLKEKEILFQMRQVLRLKERDKIILFNGRGTELLCEIEKWERDAAILKRKEFLENKNEPERKIILYCALLKKENFEWVCQKATEVGVKELWPILAKRVVKLGFKKERAEKIIKEAAEQSGRAEIPILGGLITFKEAIEKAKENKLNLFFDSTGQPFTQVLKNLPKTVGVFVGPEGGWDEEELKKAKEAKFRIVSLGKLILRSETAAILGSFLIVNF